MCKSLLSTKIQISCETLSFFRNIKQRYERDEVLLLVLRSIEKHVMLSHSVLRQSEQWRVFIVKKPENNLFKLCVSEYSFSNAFHARFQIISDLY